MNADPFLTPIQEWALIPDGPAITTHSSDLLPVRHCGRAAMLKIARCDEERRGNTVMVWWHGRGAAEVIAHDGAAILLARADGPENLKDMACSGRDDDATRILCGAAQHLHAITDCAPEGLEPLSRTFASLEPISRTQGGTLARCHAIATTLLENQRDVRVLHGDLHHDNVLDFGAGGWRAIDPKGRVGARAFDYTALFLNPDLDDPRSLVAAAHFDRRLDIVASMAGLPRTDLLMWITAFTGLSSAWSIKGGDDPSLPLSIAELALARLDA